MPFFNISDLSIVYNCGTSLNGSSRSEMRAIRDSDAGDGRLVRAKWAGLDSDLPAAGKRYARSDNIRFPLPSKNLEKGDLVLRVRDERGDSI